MKKNKIPLLLIAVIISSITNAQTISKTWVADNGDGTYKNPIINADYSDPDAIRVGDDYYLVSSSFNQSPGLPILHSKDLVNWTIIGHALQQQPPIEHFSKVQHGNGVWAPSIRYHNNEFYIYYPDPDFGIYLTKAKNISGPWTEPVLVQAGKGLIDPCPLWDDNGKNYLVHALAGSRAGFKSVILMKELNAAGDKVISDGVLVYDGHEADGTIEGPKIYKRNNYYYIFAPAGGVSTGWQTILRSKNIYGPYERKVVLEQGTTTTNGPHQGAWVQTQTGEDWFIHFQDKDAYGRVVHLEPMKWLNDWPVMGVDNNNNGIGEPVMVFRKPNIGKKYPVITPAESDEFNDSKTGLQWQWHANTKLNWGYCYPFKGVLRFNSVLRPDTAKSLWDIPNILTQKFPAEEFTATAKFLFTPKTNGEKFGLVVLGMSYADIAVTKKADGLYLSYAKCIDAEHGKPETETELTKISSGDLYFQLKVTKDAVCSFSYSSDGKIFTAIAENFKATPGKWIGATMGFFCTRTQVINDAGFAEVDWFRVEK
ncbi:glycoside hydrolase family 43 protein [Ferruginibacter sp. SUN106]|uniref:glycoside hydrolase family 43 protein n=1 Tax=Ferruginibacter sp. SUN106 TaxID=2978348 RepID=UPI003D36C734